MEFKLRLTGITSVKFVLASPNVAHSYEMLKFCQNICKVLHLQGFIDYVITAESHGRLIFTLLETFKNNASH